MSSLSINEKESLTERVYEEYGGIYDRVSWSEGFLKGLEYLEQQEEREQLRKESQERDILEMAKTIDPECWESYAGQPTIIRRQKDLRRNAARAEARKSYFQTN